MTLKITAMPEIEPPTTDPRWGSEGRDLKAEQIMQTLRHFAGRDLNDALWLDLGCGSGGITAHIAPHVRHIIGIDPEPWPRWSDWMRAHANLEFIQAGVKTVSRPPASIDVIVCNQVYEHVPDPRALIRLIHALLKPGGIAYFAGPNLLFPIEPHVFWPFVHWLPRGLAVRLMRALGSRKVLDANSAGWWRLHAWFDDLEVSNALPYFMHHALAQGRKGWRFKLLHAIPGRLLDRLSFASPGFVFILRKSHPSHRK